MSIDVLVPEYTLKFLYFAKQSTHISLTINKLVKEFHEYQTRIFDSLLALNIFFVCVLPLVVAYIAKYTLWLVFIIWSTISEVSGTEVVQGTLFYMRF